MDDPFQINIVLLFGVGNKQRDPVPLRLRRQISFLSTHTHTQSHRHWNMDLQAVKHTYNNEHTQTDKNMDTHMLTCSLILIANTHIHTTRHTVGQTARSLSSWLGCDRAIVPSRSKVNFIPDAWPHPPNVDLCGPGVCVFVCVWAWREGGWKKGGRNVLDNRVKRASEILLFCVVQKWCVLAVQQKWWMEDGRLEDFKILVILRQENIFLCVYSYFVFPDLFL